MTSRNKPAPSRPNDKQCVEEVAAGSASGLNVIVNLRVAKGNSPKWLFFSARHFWGGHPMLVAISDNVA